MLRFLKQLFCRSKLFAKGKQLDIMAEIYGIKRKRSYLVVKESDKNLKKRIINKIKSYK